MINILVVGGGGYIGSHMVKLLGDLECNVTSFDNLSTGYRNAILCGDFIEGDLRDTQLLSDIFNANSFDVVMHFASCIQVGESVLDPAKYYQNNLICTLNLLNAMRTADVRNFIFSSSAAVYGEPHQLMIDENHSLCPLNPYGRTKLMVEQILEDYDVAYGIKSISLRYFNAAGADPHGALGERHEPETHLLPLILQAASGRRASISVYGTDYPTPDGTCVRDYIHVSDICDAHWLAIKSLLSSRQSAVYNLGNGDGFSVRDIINAAISVTGKKFEVSYKAARAGDPARLVANSDKARRLLGWKPRFSDIDLIIRHAWSWEQRLLHYENLTKE